MKPASSKQRATVLAWMTETGRGPSDAVDHHWPGLSDAHRKRRCAQVRDWSRRARQKAEAAADVAPPRQRSPPPEVPAPDDEDGSPPRDDVAAMPTVDRLAWQLARVAGSLDLAFEAGDVRGVAAASKALTEVGVQLDRARREASKLGGMAEGVEGLTTKANALRDLIRRTEAHLRAQAAQRGRDL